ncbi:hypothetical protein [Paenibacillus kribbensis]|uniref:hypothetical protein n=1 Tax=Paenibacillus kribbensis TaxID=172713 RepID=UPI0015BD827E|nr:hypothetical protein [Paenibacillus kribbensis]
MERPLRERIILPIAVAPGFLDWNKPVKVGIQGQRQTLTLLQNDSVRSAASSTNPHVGAELGKVRHIRCRPSPRAIEKLCSTAFLSQATVPERTAEFAQQTDSSPSRNAQGSRGEALSHPEGAQSQHMPHAHNRRSLNARPHDVPSCGPGPRARRLVMLPSRLTAPGRGGRRHAKPPAEVEPSGV